MTTTVSTSNSLTRPTNLPPATDRHQQPSIADMFAASSPLAQRHSSFHTSPQHTYMRKVPAEFLHSTAPRHLERHKKNCGTQLEGINARLREYSYTSRQPPQPPSHLPSRFSTLITWANGKLHEPADFFSACLSWYKYQSIRKPLYLL